jgi:hypothetical protein
LSRQLNAPGQDFEFVLKNRRKGRAMDGIFIFASSDVSTTSAVSEAVVTMEPVAVSTALRLRYIKVYGTGFAI